MPKVIEEPQSSDQPSRSNDEVESPFIQLRNPFDRLRIGSFVNYVIGHGPSIGQIRPAFVVQIWGAEFPRFKGTVNLQVLTDSNEDGNFNDQLPQVMWATSVVYDSEKSPGSWHWPK